MMEMYEYQMLALRTRNRGLDNKQMLIDGLMGLNGEAGEAIDILKKHLFQGHPLDKTHLINELGDALWYIALTAFALDMPLETVAQRNIEKLSKRYPDGFRDIQSINRKEGDI